MGARPASSDPRSLRSREQILAALHRTARAGELDSISSLSSAAGVTRATFYNHFESIEEAAWCAISQSLDSEMTRDAEARHRGEAAERVGIESLRRLVELFRAEPQLVRLAESYRDDSDLPGLAGILLGTIHLFRENAGLPPSEPQDIYAASGLYALLAVGARGSEDPTAIASVAYSLLPEWMHL